MSLDTALSGINAAQDALNVTSNDLANVNTTGFRSGNQLFDDLYPAAAGSDTAGIGVAPSQIERDFSQGGTNTTNSPLDLAIQGSGFFVVSQNGVQQYTRDGHFHLDPTTNQLMTANGGLVMGYASGATGSSANVGPLALKGTSEPATPTTQQSVQLSLNTGDPAIAGTIPFSIANAGSFDESTSVTAYDSLGNPNQVQLYFRQAAGTGSATVPNAWQVYANPVGANGTATGAPSLLTTLTFDSAGALTGGGTASLPIPWGGGAGTSTVAFNFNGSTLANQPFVVDAAAGNGFPPGSFQGATVSSDGSIQAQYSNGQTSTVGHIALATFANQQGLSPVSNNLFAETSTSGNAVVNTPGQGQTGSLASGQLETSNVDLSQQLVNLITEQQAYEANTKTISTSKQDTSALLQI